MKTLYKNQQSRSFIETFLNFNFSNAFTKITNPPPETKTLNDRIKPRSINY